MPTATLDLLKDIFFLLFFYIGAAWMWGRLRFKPSTQEKLERTFQRSRERFKWMFLIGALLLTGLFVYQYFFES